MSSASAKSRTSKSAAAKQAWRSGAPPGRQNRSEVSQGTLSRAVASVIDVGAQWGPTLSRVLLGLVLAWFGYHELVQPALWTGYVPVLSPTSSLAVALVLIHGWVLLLLAVAVIAGVALRLAAAIAALMLAEVVISLVITGGLTDLTLRDMGVLGLALTLTGESRQRFQLTN